MEYFTEDYISFFKDLSKNNNKEWFHSQKKRYEESIKKPFKNFTAALISEVNKYDHRVNVQPKDCISRINKDIRFSKDKTPYNLSLNAFISVVGKKNKSIPGLFLRLSADMIGIMGGCYGLDKNQLSSVRSKLAKDAKTFKALVSNPSFKSMFGEIKGEQMKRIPKELKVACEKEPLLLNKQFYYVAELSPNLIYSDRIIQEIMKYFNVMQPVNEYLEKAMQY